MGVAASLHPHRAAAQLEVILKQYYLGCLAHASYLVADQVGGEAAVIDPQRDVDQYIADARELGCTIGHAAGGTRATFT